MAQAELQNKYGKASKDVARICCLEGDQVLVGLHASLALPWGITASSHEAPAGHVGLQPYILFPPRCASQPNQCAPPNPLCLVGGAAAVRAPGAVDGAARRRRAAWQSDRRLGPPPSYLVSAVLAVVVSLVQSSLLLHSAP